MQPRTEVTWLKHGTSLADFLDIYRQYPFSRFPVYKGTTDNVTGVLSVKDIIMAQANNSLNMDSPIDELAVQEKDFVTINANTFEVDGGLRVEEANEELDLGLPTGDYETVAGFILSHLSRIPKQGEHLKYKNLKLTILEMRERKIEKILVVKEKDAAPAP